MADVEISTGELAMANRYGQTFAEFLKEKILLFAIANAGLMPAGYQVITTLGVTPLTADLDGHLHQAFTEALAAAQLEINPGDS